MTSILITIVSALQMLASFTNYIVGDYQYISPEYACFRGENTMGSDERGVRTNADLSMVSAFMCRYAADSVALPTGITYDQLDTMAMKTLAYAVATHKAVRKRTCRDGRYWGSAGRNDKQWESSLWALSVAYSALFQWDKLADDESRHPPSAQGRMQLRAGTRHSHRIPLRYESRGERMGGRRARGGCRPLPRRQPRPRGGTAG